MDKLKILKAVQARIDDEVRRQLAAQQTAANGATHVEARAETKWDTCGLEQSYLARGHAKQFETLAQQAEELRSFSLQDFTGKPIGAGALVEVESDGEPMAFFVLHSAGGVELLVDHHEITVITPESPVGAALIGKKQGDSYSFRTGMDGRVLHVE